MVEKISTKDNILTAALELFYHQGYLGTTVRQIASKAEVNQALISYYFGGKKGLLEAVMIRFYEGYFQAVQQAQESCKHKEAHVYYPELLKTTLDAAYNFLFEQYQMARFIYRELTVDSMLIREVMTTYLSKEKHLFLAIIEEGVEEEVWLFKDCEMVVLQILNLLYMPFLQPQLIREVYYLEPLSSEFKERYMAVIQDWFETLTRLEK